MKLVEITLHRHWTSVRFSIQPTRTPTHDGRPRVHGRAVGRSVGGIKFPMLFRCADSFTWAMRIPSSGQRQLRHLCEHTWFSCLGGLLNYMYINFSSASGNLLCVILFVNNHKKRNWPWTAVFIKNLQKPSANTKMETIRALVIVFSCLG